MINEESNYALVCTGEGAVCKISEGKNLHQALHDVLCCCEKPYKECKTEFILDSINTVNDADAWDVDESFKPFHCLVDEGETYSVHVYRVSS